VQRGSRWRELPLTNCRSSNRRFDVPASGRLFLFEVFDVSYSIPCYKSMCQGLLFLSDYLSTIQSQL